MKLNEDERRVLNTILITEYNEANKRYRSDTHETLRRANKFIMEQIESIRIKLGFKN